MRGRWETRRLASAVATSRIHGAHSGTEPEAANTSHATHRTPEARREASSSHANEGDTLDALHTAV